MEWQLLAFDVETGEERLVTSIELSPDVEGVQGLSLHPDGTRFLTAASKSNHDIWMLEGFE